MPVSYRQNQKNRGTKKVLGPEYEGVVGSDSWGAWNQQRHKNATYTTSVTSRKLFCITPQVPTIRDMHEHSGAYLKTHTSAMQKKACGKEKVGQAHALLGLKGCVQEAQKMFTFLEVDRRARHQCVILRNITEVDPRKVQRP